MNTFLHRTSSRYLSSCLHFPDSMQPDVRQSIIHKFWSVPTVLWWSEVAFILQSLMYQRFSLESEPMLVLVCLLGVVLSVLVVMGLGISCVFVILFVLYLSVVSVGQTFASFQWDILLLETGATSRTTASNAQCRIHLHILRTIFVCEQLWS